MNESKIKNKQKQKKIERKRNQFKTEIEIITPNLKLFQYFWKNPSVLQKIIAKAV
jgi:hypothetical protein